MRLGARSLPVVARGDKFVIAQIIRDVVEFLGLDADTKPQLPPAELAQRYDRILEAAIRFARQMPNSFLERQLPNRPRSWRVLMHHLFQIPVAFLDAEATGEVFDQKKMLAGPPEAMRSSAEIAGFGEGVRERFKAWWQGAKDKDFGASVPAYFGQTTRHELLERTVWHSTQHVRQLMSLLEQAGIAPDRPLARADWQGLPLTEKIWDET